jgi:hypothetical protein
VNDLKRRASLSHNENTFPCGHIEENSKKLKMKQATVLLSLSFVHFFSRADSLFLISLYL